MDQFELAYRLGFAAGDTVGYGRANHELDLAWARVAQEVRRAATQPTHAQILWRRNGHGELHRAFTIRHGREYTGGPVNWYTGRPR